MQVRWLVDRCARTNAALAAGAAQALAGHLPSEPSTHNVFLKLNAWLVSSGFSLRTVFWTTGALAFVISPVCDNLTTALLMGTVVTAVGRGNIPFIAAACTNVVIAANAGGAFSPFGDITTLMVWAAGKVETAEFSKLLLPSLVNWLVPAALMHFTIPKGKPEPLQKSVELRPGWFTVIVLFVLTIVTAVLFHVVLHLPPFLHCSHERTGLTARDQRGGGAGDPAPRALLQVLHFLDDPFERFLRVEEHHQAVVHLEQRVLDARVAGRQRALDDDDRARLVDVEDRHAGDRAGGLARGRVHDVVGADDDDDVGVLEVAVDAIHLPQLLVRHVRLGEQHVHVAGHAAGDRVDRVAHVAAALLSRSASSRTMCCACATARP
jgi:hypothetical protein